MKHLQSLLRLTTLLLAALTVVSFYSCEHQPLELNTPENVTEAYSNPEIESKLEGLFKEYSLVKLNTDHLFTQMISENGETKSLTLDIEGIPINDFELINDNAALDTDEISMESNIPYYYMKSTGKGNPNDISWFSFNEGMPMYANIITRPDNPSEENGNTVHIIETVRDYLELTDEETDAGKYKDIYVVYNFADYIAPDTDGCSTHEGLGN